VPTDTSKAHAQLFQSVDIQSIPKQMMFTGDAMIAKPPQRPAVPISMLIVAGVRTPKRSPSSEVQWLWSMLHCGTECLKIGADTMRVFARPALTSHASTANQPCRRVRTVLALQADAAWLRAQAEPGHATMH